MRKTLRSVSNSHLYWVSFLLLTPFITATDQFRTTKFQNYTYQTLTTPITLSKNDKRQYEGLILSNQLEVLLISDKEVDRSAAALDVKVGSQSDPKSLPGLAHFCEHLLFMGNEKYPDEDDYFKYLQSRSGSANAYTDYEDTNYYFHVSNEALDGGLDRFAQFFISPLFKEDSVGREVQAVDSEHKKNLQDDEWRIRQTQKMNSNPEYPYSYFATGDAETLSKLPKSKGIDVRKELLKFYKSYYSSNRMKLVVIGKEPLSELKKMVIPRFSKIPDRNLKAPVYPGKPFTDNYLRIQINIVPVGESSSLTMEFQLPSQQGNYNDKPTYYISYLLEHEGSGSLTTNLKRRGWVLGNSVGVEEDRTKFALFRVKFDLTPTGLSHADEIIKLTFAYLKLIKERGISMKIFDEMKAIQVNQFQYLEKMQSPDYASSLAAQLHSPIPFSQIISSSHIITNYNSSLIQKTLQYLNPKNIRVTLVSPTVSKLNNLKKEPHYGTQYTVTKIKSDILKSWENVQLDPSLKLPESNPFISKNFDLVKTSSKSKFPELLKNQTGQVLWYTTGEVTIPKVSLRLMIKNNQWFQSPDQMARLTLFKSIILEDLNHIGFMALQAGLIYNVKIQYPGIAIQVEGFSDKADKFMATIVDQVRNFNITQGSFNYTKEKVARGQRNFNNQAPYELIEYYLKLALKENSWTNDQLANVTNKLTMNDIVKFQRQSINRGSLELLVLGNFDETRSHSLLDKIQSTLKLQTIEPKLGYTERAVVMKNNTNLIHTIPISDKNEVNSAIGFYLDMYAYPDAQQRATVKLIAQMIQQPAFNQLRTKEQLGYVVLTSHYPIASRGGILVIVQSERDPSYLESRVDNMLQKFVKDTMKITEKAFQSEVKSLSSSFKNQQRNLGRMSDFYWDVIMSGYADFQRDNTTLYNLNSLTKSQLLTTIRTMISPSRRKLSLQLLSNSSKSTTKLTGTVIPDLIEWRKRQTLSDYPHPLGALTKPRTTTSSPNLIHQGGAILEAESKS